MSNNPDGRSPLQRPAAGLQSWPHRWPVLILVLFGLIYWAAVLFGGQVLLPGAMLRGFAPFGSDPNAPWTILQWDALGQYYPWRLLAARQLHSGLIPLWNPHQFAGTPFLANGQSAVFYPLNLPFWLMDVAYAFGISALLHALLAALGTYFLAQRWQLSRAASLLAAVGFGFGGYLGAWIVLPTLAATASWLPLTILCLEAAAVRRMPGDRPVTVEVLPLAGALCCALLAGHPQVFFYLLVALLLRALTLARPARACGLLVAACCWCLALSALQLLPMLELARLGHRAAQGGPTLDAWHGIAARALQYADLPSLAVPGWPMQWGSLNENFGYAGVAVCLLAIIGLASLLPGWIGQRRQVGSADPTVRTSAPAANGLTYSAVLAVFGLLYALGTPLAMGFYFLVPGLSQMGGVGRALLLWSLGASLLAAFGLDALRSRWGSQAMPLAALLVVAGEVFAVASLLHPTAPRRTVYPATTLTRWLQSRTQDGSRILFLTPRGSWLPTEALQAAPLPRSHPPGVLPTNGATVYGLNDVNGYDSLASRDYRNYVMRGEGGDVAPQLNGNMILLNNPASPALDGLNVRYIVSETPLSAAGNRQVLQADGCYVYQRSLARVPQVNGSDFYPGWRAGRYQPTSFKFGAFVSFCALAGISLLLMARRCSIVAGSDFR